MGRRFGYQALLGLVMLAMLAGVGAYTYNLGVAHGVAVAGSGTVPGGAPPMAYWPAFDEWHRRAHAQQGPPSSPANV